MREYKYNIVLNTLLGERNGTMRILVDGEKIDGFLSVLEKTQPINGTVNKNGLCNLSGKIVTLMKEFVYTATGYMDEKRIELILKSGKSTFQMTGAVSCMVED